jgi:serralysin
MSSIGGVTLAEAPTLDQVNANRAAAGYLPLSETSYNIRMAALVANPDAGLLFDNVGIAYGTIIENAVGGGGNDIIIGNTASNKIWGGAGNDIIAAGAGIDYVWGGAGADTFVADIDGATFVAKKGPIALDVINDFVSGTDKIDLRGIDANAFKVGDQAFTFHGTAANKFIGGITYKTYTSVNGAEQALGIDIDGLSSKGADVPVTVVFGNTDGGGADFGIVLIGVSSVTASDFYM